MKEYPYIVRGTPGLVEHYRLGESSGTTAAGLLAVRDGTYVGTPTLGVAGAINNDNDTAVEFNGSTQWVTAGTTSILSEVSNKTFLAWIKPDVLKFQGIVDQEYDDLTPGNYGGWGFWVDGAGKLVFWPHPEKDITDPGSATVVIGVYQHVACTWDSSAKEVTFFRNGMQSGTASDGAIVEQASGSAPLMIGNLRNNLNSGMFAFDGVIDEVSIFSRKLTAVEIAMHYSFGRRRGLGLAVPSLAGGLT